MYRDDLGGCKRDTIYAGLHFGLSVCVESSEIGGNASNTYSKKKK